MIKVDCLGKNVFVNIDNILTMQEIQIDFDRMGTLIQIRGRESLIVDGMPEQIVELVVNARKKRYQKFTEMMHEHTMAMPTAYSKMI